MHLNTKEFLGLLNLVYFFIFTNAVAIIFYLFARDVERKIDETKNAMLTMITLLRDRDNG